MDLLIKSQTNGLMEFLLLNLEILQVQKLQKGNGLYLMDQ
jgi:hypothetical protein